MPRIKYKTLRSLWGYYDKDADQIVIHKGLPEKWAIPTKNSVIKHEQFHQWSKDKFITYDIDETLANVYSILNTPKKTISWSDLVLRRMIQSKLGRIRSKKSVYKYRLEILQILRGN